MDAVIIVSLYIQNIALYDQYKQYFGCYKLLHQLQHIQPMVLLLLLQELLLLHINQQHQNLLLLP